LNSGREAREIFLGELTALKMLDHPNIVKMYEYDIDGQIETQVSQLKGVWFIALEYISQQTLIDLVREFGSLGESFA
jgi:serine/threonine protein kinase